MPYEKFEGDLIRPIKDAVKDGDPLLMRDGNQTIGMPSQEEFEEGEEIGERETL